MQNDNDWFRVANVSFANHGITVSKGLIARDVDGEVYWESDPIDISCYFDVYFTLSVYGGQHGDLTPFPGDYVTVYYKLDGGSELLLSSQLHAMDGVPFDRDLNSNTLGLDINNNCNGTINQELVIIVKVKNDAGNERHGFDNLEVRGTPVNLSVTEIEVFNCPVAPTLTFTASSVCGIEYLPPGAPGWIPAGINPVSLGLAVGSLPYEVQIRDKKFPNCAAYTVTVGADCMTALPITLAGFTGRPVDGGVRLDWFTEGEEDNDYMAVERSPDGRVFDEIGRVPGRGTTAERQTYRHFDARPLPGVNYYRLRQVDFDGATAYHPVISVVFEGRNELVLEAFPNPAGEELRVRWQSPGARAGRLRIVDPRGIVRQEQVLTAGGGLERISLADLPAGIYFLQLLQGEAVRTVRFVRE